MASGNRREEPEGSRETLDRRAFLRQVGAGTGAAGLAVLRFGAPDHGAEADEGPRGEDARRAQQAYKIRVNAAKLARERPDVTHPNNGEEELYPNKIASYSKALPHNGLGEADLVASRAMIKGLRSGQNADFEAIPLGLGRRLTSPQAGLAFDLEGPDSHHLTMRPAPMIAGAEPASELAELYWMSLARDVDFSEYDGDPTIGAAAADLSPFTDFRGPKVRGKVVPATIFRGNTPGDLLGPYLSQFLWLDIPMGAVLIPQRMRSVLPGVDSMTEYTDWLNIQNGFAPGPQPLDAVPRYIRNLRDLAEWVHVDALYQAYHQACLILLGMGARFDEGNPYTRSATQLGFGTFGGPHILSLVTEVATRALKAVWFQKWFVHRRLRPEAFGGLVHNTVTRQADYPIHREVLNSRGLKASFSKYGTYLLPLAYPEGSPTHPSYGAGHATVAGACVTILKAWFDESFVLPNPVVADASGTALIPYDGTALTVGNELNKLAANVAVGRNAAGIHYRSDYFDSLQLGEAVAIGILEEQKETYSEGGTFTITKFDGTTITI